MRRTETGNGVVYGPVVVHMILQSVVTVALLVFAYLVRHDDPSVSSVVVGAAVLHWLRESSTAGRQAIGIVSATTPRHVPGAPAPEDSSPTDA